MARYNVHGNPNPRSLDEVPYLVDVQSDLLSERRTRLVMPLKRVEVGLAQAPCRLSPQFTVKGERLALNPLAMAGLDARWLPKPLALLAAHAGEIRDSLGALVSGIWPETLTDRRHATNLSWATSWSVC